MVIHGLLVTCFRSLAFDFQLLEMVVCVCVLKKMPCLGNRCNNSLLECFTKVCVFSKRCFNVFESCFESCIVKWVLKVGKCVLQV